MAKATHLSCALLLLLAAGTPQAQSLDETRVSAVQQYIAALQSANMPQMLGLFAPGGTVVSTSRGNVNADSFFAGFFPEIQLASTHTSAIYKSVGEEGKYSASFAFSWTLKSGESGGGHYVDEFTFTEGGSQLQTVYMYENLTRTRAS